MPEESTATSDDIVSGIEAALFAPTEPEEETSQTPEETETTEEGVEETEEKQEETEAEEEESDEEDETSSSEEDDEDGLELTGDEFATMLGIDSKNLVINEDGSIALRTKAGEEEENVTIDALIKSYQTDKHVTQKSQAVSEAQKAFEQERIDYVNQATERLNQAAGLVQVLEKQMLGDIQSVDWEQLRINDPAEYAARRQELSDKQSSIDQMKGQLQQGVKSITAEQQQEMDAKRNQLLEAEGEKLLAAIPEWNNPDVASSEKSAIGEFMVKKYGFTDKDIEAITDHRAILIVRDAMKYQESKSKVSVAEKKVRKLPKISRPGKNKKQTTKDSKVKATRRVRLKESGSVDDAAALLYDIM